MLRQEDYKVKVCLGYRVSSMQASLGNLENVSKNKRALDASVIEHLLNLRYGDLSEVDSI